MLDNHRVLQPSESDPQVFAPDRGAGEPRRAKRRRRGATRSVLLVEDHRGDALLAERALKGQDFTLHRVASLDEACGELDVQPPFDAVLLDLMLPDGSRIDALRRVRARCPGVPIVALTGLDDEELARACISAGAQDYIRKSELSATILPRVLEHAIARQRATELGRRLELAEQHAALGRISMTVAHEINNQTSGALSAAEHAVALCERMRLHLAPEGAEHADELESVHADLVASIKHLAAFTSELKNLGKLSGDSVAPVDADAVATRVVRMLESRLAQVARVELDLGGAPAVLASDQKLTQVLVNLLLNAADAIDEGAPEANRIAVRTEQKNARVAIAVSDSGCGIPESARRRLFEPFFTSKESERGTGLGLAVCHDAVLRLGGRLEVESELGVGTTFTALLPMAERPARPPAPTPARDGARDRARVLLIDDESTVRRALERLLRAHHDIESVDGGAAALERLNADPDYDAVLCDIMMPDVDGLAVAQELAEKNPELLAHTAFLSGGAVTERARSLCERGEHPIIEKPATRDELLGAIDAVRRRRRG